MTTLTGMARSFPEKTIECCIDDPNNETYRIIADNKKSGGVILKINKETGHNELEILFTSPDEHSKGIGFGARQAIMGLHPETKIWETCTPCFEKRHLGDCGNPFIVFNQDEISLLPASYFT